MVYELTPYGHDLRPVIHELARWGARSLGPPSRDALEPGWLLHALDHALSPLAHSGRLAFRIGDEEASLVDGRPVAGIVEDADVLVETDAVGFYNLVVNGDVEGVRIEGDAGLLERVLAAFGPSLPLPA